MPSMALALQVNLPSPVGRLGSRKERTGQPATRHLQHSMCVFSTEHGRLPYGCQEQWGRSEGATAHESSMPEGRVGGGIGVGTQESCGHGAYSPWRRPLALGVRAHEGVSRECAS